MAFGLLTSRMHMVWTRTVGGRMKTDYRYSNTVVYNNFPVPELSARAKSELTDAALRVLDVREHHSEMTLAQLYDPDTMPQDLRIAHEQLDLLVDSLYRDTPSPPTMSASSASSTSTSNRPAATPNSSNSERELLYSILFNI